LFDMDEIRKNSFYAKNSWHILEIVASL
jgi:hypothetical protein